MSLHDNSADSEIVFSMVKKTDVDCRSDLSQETICSLLSCKLNTGDACHGHPCHECQPSDQLLKAAKSATWNYVKAHPELRDV